MGSTSPGGEGLCQVDIILPVDGPVVCSKSKAVDLLRFLGLFWFFVFLGPPPLGHMISHSADRTDLELFMYLRLTILLSLPPKN